MKNTERGSKGFGLTDQKKKSKEYLLAIKMQKDQVQIIEANYLSNEEIKDIQPENLSQHQIKVLQTLLSRYAHLFAKDINELGRTHAAKHQIDTGNARPFKSRPYRTPRPEQTFIREEIQ